MAEVSLKELIQAGAHFGHQTRRWNPKMKEYIYGDKDGVHIFDLTKTKACLDEALGALTEAAREGKSILLLGTKKQAREQVEEVAKDTDSFYVNERWLGGTISNFDQIRLSTQKLTDLKKGLESGEFKDRTKKERLLIEKEIQRLERFFKGIVGMKETPDVLFVIDTKRERTAIREAHAKGITVIGVVDTNADPAMVDYPIPMNDDATRALEYVLKLVKEAILEGKKPIRTTKGKNSAKGEKTKKKSISDKTKKS